jgi:hypothetical protein
MFNRVPLGSACGIMAHRPRLPFKGVGVSTA